METKRVTEDFGDRSIMPMWTPLDIADIMKEIEKIFEECDEELVKAEMAPLGYEKQPIDTMTEHAAILISYAFDAYPQCSRELDHPLYVGFKNGATETLSNIVLEDITTENTFGMQRYVELSDVEGTFYQAEIKPELSMKDFFTEEVVPGGRAPVIENVETLGWFTALFRADYENMAGAVESPEQLFEFYLHGGEYGHKEYHPIGNFISGILDVTIIKPLIESIWGQDLITGEKLTDFERGMQLINAVVGALTLGQGAMALNFAEMTGKQVVTGLLKTWAVDAVADMSAYTVGCVCDELGLPAGITFIAGLMTGCTVSVKAGKYVFEDAGGKIVKELDADGMWEYVGGVEYKGGTYSAFGEMSEADGIKYSNWMKVREAGLDQVKVNDIILTNKGYRPDPVEYLSKEYIEEHLAQFDEGISVIQSGWDYGRYSEINGFVGVPDDNTLFVMPKAYCDEIILKANGNMSIIEKELGFPEGYFSDRGGLVRIDVEDTSGLNLRIPNGNETGANSLWTPGGYTSGNIPEVISDIIPLEKTEISRININ